MWNYISHIPCVCSLAHEIEDQIGLSVQVNMYLTPPGAQGFEVHWDVMETVVLQVLCMHGKPFTVSLSLCVCVCVYEVHWDEMQTVVI